MEGRDNEMIYDGSDLLSKRRYVEIDSVRQEGLR